MPDDDDIIIRLAMAALDPESAEPAEVEALLREAIKTIEPLRGWSASGKRSSSKISSRRETPKRRRAKWLTERYRPIDSSQNRFEI